MFPKKLHLQSLIECDHFFRYPLEIKRKSLTSFSQMRVPWQEILNRNLDFSCVFVEKEDWFGKIVDHEEYLLFGEGQHASEKENSEKKKKDVCAPRGTLGAKCNIANLLFHWSFLFRATDFVEKVGQLGVYKGFIGVLYLGAIQF